MAEVILSQSDFEGENREQLFDDCCSLYCGFILNLTDDDKSYLDWIGDRYEVTRVLNSNRCDRYVSIDQFEISQALASDGIDRLPGCSEDLLLNQIIWRIGPDIGGIEQ